MMSSSWIVAPSDTQQPPTYVPEERSAIAAGSASVSGTNAETSTADDTGFKGSRKKRKRSTIISCELCKTRKVKCDRVEPSCGWCARNNRVCVYKDRKKPGLRVGYGRELENKINRLEAIIQVLGCRVEDHILNHHDPKNGPEPPLPNHQSPDFSLDQSVPRSADADTGSQNIPIPDSSDFRWPQADTYERMQYSRPAESMTIQSVVGTTAPENLAEPACPRSSTPSANFGQTPTLSEPDLPPYDLLYTLVDLYFKHINTWSPILDRKATFDELFGNSTLNEPECVLLHAIVATTLRFSKDPRLTPESRKQYHEVSKQKVQLYGLEHPNVRALQALIILAVDILGTSNGPQGWNMLALIVRNIVQLGLCVEKSVFLAPPTYQSIGSLQAYVLPQPKTWIEDEGRRRLLWMVYVLDRYATVATAFDFTLDESEMDRPLPCRYDLFSQIEPVETRWFRGADRSQTTLNRPENLGSFSYHCEVLTILSRIHRLLRRPIDIGSAADVQQWRDSYQELDGELNTWLHSLPGEYGKISQLCHSDPASKVSNWIMLHAAFVTSVIRLHSSAAYPTVTSHILKPSYNAIKRCLAAAESLREIAQDVVHSGMLDLLGPPFAFSLWVSARLLLVHAATTQCGVDPNVHFFISTLEQMGQFWPVAQNYAEILSRVVQEHQQNEHSFAGANVANLAKGKTLTAMRRCAYDLILLISQRRCTVLHPTSTRTPSSNELEYLDIFDFFNYPRLPSMVGNDLNVSDSAANARNLGQINDLRAPNFAMPNPECDWLVFKPPHD